MSNFLWLVAVMIGPLLLGGAIVYGLMRQRRLTPNEMKRSDMATRELYERDEAADTRHLGGRS
ncbi:hypothetical protein FJQ55_15355 [Rhizobium glycinendophyticum]|uniref:Uncharacterized protein n=1 Tax=Rhizobium glycinendophyticum TaxID=2589807 RepID=A0A504U9K7_9HYPH|nr:hypothetical protein FJQ55_15355 [Rhizobium glycinendophyticum]